MKEQTLEKLKESSDRFMQTVRSFSPEQFNQKPFEQSWSAGQVAQHIFLSMRGIPDLFTLRTEKNKDYTKNWEQLRTIFTNYDTKLEAPAFILPADQLYDQAQLIAALEEKFKAIQKVTEENDLTEIVTDVPFPGIGPLSRYEWIWFTIFHTDRHARQLAEIRKLVE